MLADPATARPSAVIMEFLLVDTPVARSPPGNNSMITAARPVFRR